MLENKNFFGGQYPAATGRPELAGPAEEVCVPGYWKDFFGTYQKLSPQELKKRSLDMQRLLKENGVTYTIYNHSTGHQRSWEIDTIPYIIPEEEWVQLTKGLEQRAALLNLILQDIYGPQRLIRENIIPAELIYEHPGFVRQMVGVGIKGNSYLPFYSADMARSADGQFWIMADRTQAPSGSGYALENRQAMSRALPELFAGMPVRRLSTYFDAVYNTLVGIAPRGIENPRIVVLTPGSGNETYFEHAYLAAFLGLSLVEGNDLMVKGDHVWLKTMEGLEKVDVIMRRVDDSYCDSLELRPESLLGIPGLLHVVRKGNIALANPLGSSVVENAGLVPFLPRIAQYFGLGDLWLPSIATWWCGQEKEKEYVLEHFTELIIKKIYRSGGGKASVFDGAALSEKEKLNLKAAIQKQPQLYIGQEKVVFAATPISENEHVTAGHAVFRSFLVNDGQQVNVMPGGLTRTGDDKDGIIISNQIGSLSKDTWILGEDAAENIAAVQQHRWKNTVNNHAGTLPSHTAETLFWVGRYIERVIGNARLLKTVVQYIFQGNRQESDNTFTAEEILLRALTAVTYTHPGFIEGEDHADALANPWPELRDLVLNEQRTGSLAFTLHQFRNNIFSTREYWNLDIWKVIHQMDNNWVKAALLPQGDPVGIIESIESVTNSMYAILGLNRESVRRDQGWRMMDTGRKLEQSLNSIVLLKSVFAAKQEEGAEHDLIESVLSCNQSLVTYRYTYRDYLQMPLMLDLLVLDTENPKALSYMIGKLKANIQHLPKSENNGQRLSEQERLLLEADTKIRLADKYALSKINPKTQEYQALQTFLDEIYDLLFPVAELVSKAYFKHTVTQTQLIESLPIL